MIQSKLPSPIILLSKKNCKVCDEQYVFFRDVLKQFVIKVDFSETNLEFRQILTKVLKKSFNDSTISYPIILLPDFESRDNQYYVIVGFNKNMFITKSNFN